MIDTSCYDRYEWKCVPIQEVKSGDLYANNATVTASRRAKRGEWFDDPVEGHKGKWTIKCGKSLRLTAEKDRAVVVGRIPWLKEDRGEDLWSMFCMADEFLAYYWPFLQARMDARDRSRA